MQAINSEDRLNQFERFLQSLDKTYNNSDKCFYVRCRDKENTITKIEEKISQLNLSLKVGKMPSQLGYSLYQIEIIKD